MVTIYTTFFNVACNFAQSVSLFFEKRGFSTAAAHRGYYWEQLIRELLICYASYNRLIFAVFSWGVGRESCM